MKIKNIKIRNYGPIEDFSFSPGNFELIFGLNESGKTAIVEALSSVLFQRRSDTLRYDKPENVKIEIEAAGKLHVLPSKKPGVELLAGETASLMYVQASDASVFEAETQNRFWDGLKLKLTQAGPGVSYTRIIERIIDRVGLTLKNREWKKEKKNIIDHETKRLDDLNDFLTEIGKIEQDRVELAKLKDRLKGLKRDLATIEKFKAYSIYQQLRNWFDEYVDKRNLLNTYARYEDRYLEQWQQLEAQKSSWAKNEEMLAKTQNDIKKIEEELGDIRAKDKLIKDAGFESAEETQLQAQKEPSFLYSAMAFLGGVIALIISIAFKVTLLIPLLVFGLSIILFALFLYKKAAIQKLSYAKELKLETAKLIFPEIRNLSELSEKIALVRQGKIKKETIINEKTDLIKNFSEKKVFGDIEKALSELRSKTGLAELSQLKEKIDEKTAVLRKLGELGGKIHGMLGEKDDGKWGRLIDEKKVGKPDINFDASREQEVVEKIKGLEDTIFEKDKAIKVFEEMKRKTYNVLDDHRAFVEYYDLKKRIENYNLEKRAALKAAEIFEQMSGELDDFIQNITEGKNSLSDYFRLVTDRYDEVIVRDRDFIAVDKQGLEYPGDDLSSGAQDQLLLCFRLAALNRTYPDGIFLILDDAFIFADWPRRRKLAELLKNFVQAGNQVIYLTSDDHTRELFKECGARLTTI